jgi:hypothetical protein
VLPEVEGSPSDYGHCQVPGCTCKQFKEGPANPPPPLVDEEVKAKEDAFWRAAFCAARHPPVDSHGQFDVADDVDYASAFADEALVEARKRNHL